MAFATVHERHPDDERVIFFKQGLWPEHTLLDGVRQQAEFQGEKAGA